MDKNIRFQALKQLTSRGVADSFGWYALAMEYLSRGMVNRALNTFQKLRDRDSGYLPMYLMASRVLVSACRVREAHDWLVAGIGVAEAAGNSHARDEMKALLEQLGDAVHAEDCPLVDGGLEEEEDSTDSNVIDEQKQLGDDDAKAE